MVLQNFFFFSTQKLNQPNKTKSIYNKVPPEQTFAIPHKFKQAAAHVFKSHQSLHVCLGLSLCWEVLFHLPSFLPAEPEEVGVAIQALDQGCGTLPLARGESRVPWALIPTWPLP